MRASVQASFPVYLCLLQTKEDINVMSAFTVSLTTSALIVRKGGVPVTSATGWQHMCVRGPGSGP